MKYSDFSYQKDDVIICGRLGASLAAEIYGQGNDVCIADRDRDAFRKLDQLYGGLTGDGGCRGFGNLIPCIGGKG